MKKEFKAHPLMILSYLKPYFFVLFLPIIKVGLQYFIKNKSVDIIDSEFFIFGIIALICIIRYRKVRIACEKDKIIIKTGFLYKKRAEIKIKNLSSVQTLQNPLDAICKAVTYNINTEAGVRDKPDFKVKLSLKDADSLSKFLYIEKNIEKVQFSPLNVAIMVATTSSAFSGMILGVPIINRAANLLGGGIYEMLLDELNNVSSRIKNYFPPIVNAITLVLLLGYAISFIYSFFKYIKFKLLLNNDKLEVHSGFFVKTKTAFKKSCVNNVMIIQAPLMILIKRYALKVSVGGFGERMRESQVIVPLGKKEEIKRNFSEYFSFLIPDGKTIRANRNLITKSRFLFWPTVWLLIVIPISIFCSFRFTNFNRFILFVTYMLLGMIFYYAYICFLEFRNGEIKLGKNIFANSTKGFRICRLYCPKEKVGEIKITRIFTDFYYKTCKIKITVCSESADSIRVKHLDYSQVISEVHDCFGIKA